MCLRHPLATLQIATSPVLVLVGIIIFASAVIDINWEEYTEAIPVLVTTTIMPFTSNVRPTCWLATLYETKTVTMPAPFQPSVP